MSFEKFLEIVPLKNIIIYFVMANIIRIFSYVY